MRLPNKRLKLPARVNYGMTLSSAHRCLSAIRQATTIPEYAFSHGQSVELDGGHFIFLDRRDAVVRAMRRFFRAVLSPS